MNYCYGTQSDMIISIGMVIQILKCGVIFLQCDNVPNPLKTNFHYVNRPYIHSKIYQIY